MSATKRRVAVILSAVLVLAVIISALSMTSLADNTARSDYSVKFTEGGFIHADRFSGYNKVFIIDVSSYQTSVDWDKVYAAGIDGVMLRVGYTGYKYGTYNNDKSFETYYNAAKAAGLKVGAYYFGQPTSLSDAETEASFTLGLLNGREFDLPIAYDLEYATNSSGITGRLYEAGFTSSALTSVANAFCKKIESAGHQYEAMVYTGCSMLTSNMIQSQLKYPVWLARYHSYVDYNCTYTMWQFSSTQSVDGVSGNCDVSVLYVPVTSSSEETTTVPTAYAGGTGSTETTTEAFAESTTKSTTKATTKATTKTTTERTTESTSPESTTAEETTTEVFIILTEDDLATTAVSTGTTAPAVRTTVAETTASADETTAADDTSDDAFTSFLDMLLRFIEALAMYIPKIIAAITG